MRDTWLLQRTTYFWFQTLDLYTAESVPPSFVGWVNALLGTIFHSLGFSSIGAYHASVLLLTIIVFVAVYKLSKSILALYLFAIFHIFPYHDYWNNTAVPAVRLGGVPHQLLVAMTSILIFYWTVHPKKALPNLFLASFILASLQPVLWAFMTAVSGISAITFGLIKRMNVKQLGIFCLPVVFMIIGGIIPALYLSNLFTTLPFTQLKAWESVQNTPYTLLQFFLASGPVLLIAIVSLPSYLSKLSFTTLLNFLFPLFSIALFLSPVPGLFGFTHVRFMSTLAIACLSIIAAYGISKIKKRVLSIAIIGILTLILLPSHVRSIQLGGTFHPSDAFQFLSKSDYAFLQTPDVNPNSVFLLIWPYNVVFPGLTGKRSYNGHPLLTINAAQKDAASQQFFDGSLSDQAMRKLLTDSHITHVVGYTWTPKLSSLLFLTTAYTKGSLVLYTFNP